MSHPEPTIVAPPPALAGMVAREGTAAEAFVTMLCSPGAATRDLSDAIHSVCALHGHHPGVLEHAAEHADRAPDWLASAAEAFAGERAWLVALVAAAGPLPSTPGQAEAEGAIAAQRHAFAMLAGSDRAGCAPGAAAALVLDWPAIHALLVVAADRFGVASRSFVLPVPTIDDTHQRAALFAAQQVLAQHRGLWQLLESRAAARRR